MAEVRKKVAKDQYDTTKIKRENDKKKAKKEVKEEKKKEIVKKEEGKKQNLFVRFRIFCHGVKSEFEKVHWPSRKDMLKYSVATIFFIIFCSVFFYLIDVIFALIQSLL